MAEALRPLQWTPPVLSFGKSWLVIGTQSFLRLRMVPVLDNERKSAKSGKGLKGLNPELRTTHTTFNRGHLKAATPQAPTNQLQR